MLDLFKYLKYNNAIQFGENIMATNHIKDIPKDVLKHTHGLGIFEMVKTAGDLEQTEIQTVDPEKTVIFKGKTVNPVTDF